MTTRELWLIQSQADGRLLVDITRLADGRVMCQLCLRYTRPDDLFRDDNGRQQDICAPCKWVRSGIPPSICHCRCCIEFLYWQQHGRPRYTLADTCTCGSYVDRGMACKCRPCLNHSPRQGW